MKALMVVAIVVSSTILAEPTGEVPDHKDLWAYRNLAAFFGPSRWQLYCPDCGGQSQSPINIPTRLTKLNFFLQPFDFTDYGKSAQVELDNDGHTVAAVLSSEESLILRGGGLTKPYKVHNIHFHWGSNSTKGSEHSINGKFYPLEMHIVHYDAIFSSLTAAVASGNSDALAVLGIHFKIGHRSNCRLDSVIDKLGCLTSVGTKLTVHEVFLEDFLPRNRAAFYRYKGSLTAPECNEQVVWTIFKEQVEISEEQIEKFRMLDSVLPGLPMINTFRPLQALNGRAVYASPAVFLHNKRPQHNYANFL